MVVGARAKKKKCMEASGYLGLERIPILKRLIRKGSSQVIFEQGLKEEPTV